jgi:hypothetical protein
VYLGGQVTRTSTAGADATFTAFGRSFTWVGTLGPNTNTWGRADIYVDGVLARTITERGSYAIRYHAALTTFTFDTGGQHTIRIVCHDPGKQIEVDGFLVLR